MATKVTPKIFDAVKTLLESDAPITEIAKFMKLSWKTIDFVKKAETYDEYKSIAYDYWKSKHEKKKPAEKPVETPAEKQPDPVPQPTQVVEHRQTITVQATHFMDGKLDKIVELLTVINAKLGAIIDDLYGTKGGNAV